MEDYEIVSVLSEEELFCTESRGDCFCYEWTSGEIFLCEDAEVTIEANPGTVDSEKLMTYRNAE